MPKFTIVYSKMSSTSTLAFPLNLNYVSDGSGYREDYISSLTPRYLNNRAQSIFGGSDEIQLNIIAKVILGL